MAYIPKMITLTPEDAAWVRQRNMNMSLFVRWALEIAKESDKTDVREVVERQRKIIGKLQELIGAYELDRKVENVQ